MEVNPDFGVLRRCHDELRESILRVHHVEEREFGIQAHRRHDLEKGAMGSVFGVGVSRADGVTGSDPGFEEFIGPLVTHFRGEGIGTLT